MTVFELKCLRSCLNGKTFHQTNPHCCELLTYSIFCCEMLLRDRSLAICGHPELFGIVTAFRELNNLRAPLFDTEDRRAECFVLNYPSMLVAPVGGIIVDVSK